MHPKRILVADDDVAIRELLSRQLRKAGHEVSTVEDGREAIKHLQRHPVDVVLTDLIMPIMDGFEVISYAQKRHPKVRLIAMSGYGESLSQAAAKLGALNVVEKPFRIRSLLGMIGSE